MFCTARDSAPRLAVLGIFSRDEHLHLRTAVRLAVHTPATATAQASESVLARFVMRGLGVGSEVLDESHAHGDMIFVKGAASAGRKAGPLQSLLLWYKCALDAWPNTELIGKADDDTWIELRATASHLRGSLQWLHKLNPMAGPPQMLWGIIETYGWNTSSQRPKGFGYKFGSAPSTCSDSASFLYPVHFAKGPIYFVSRRLVGELTASESVRTEAARAIASSAEHGVPWEDVFTGMALARVARLDNETTFAYVHAGAAVFGEATGRAYSRGGFKRTTIAWHDKNTARTARYHSWAAQAHCYTHASDVKLNCQTKQWTSCGGARWYRCLYLQNYSMCPASPMPMQ